MADEVYGPQPLLRGPLHLFPLLEGPFSYDDLSLLEEAI
jgi:hypothetical protein